MTEASFNSFIKILIPIFAFSLFACSGSERKERPVAKDGVLDLSSWDLAKEGPVELNGDWDFYWSKFVEPRSFEKRNSPKADKMILIPSAWNDSTLAGHQLPGLGFATYHLTLILPTNSPDLAIRIYDGQGSAYKLYWNNKLVARNGNPAQTETDERAEYLPQTSGVRHGNVVHLVMHVSNHSHRNGGFQVPVLLGESRTIFSARDRARLANSFLAGALLIMGLYHMGLFLYRKKDKETLWFSLMCLVITMRVLLSGERILGENFRFIPWAIFIRAEYLAFYLGAPAMGLFFHALFPREFKRGVLIAILIGTIPMILSVLVLSPGLFTQTLPAYQGLILLSGLYAIIALIMAIVHKQKGAKLMLLGILVFFATVVNDFVYYYFYIGPGYLTPSGLFFFTFAHAAVLGRRVASAFNTSEELSVNLEKKVIDRTKQLSEERDRTEAARNEAENEKAKSERLLLNILPTTVAEELKNKGTVTPSFYESATILFTDFAGFTKIAEEMQPKDLVESLHACFSQFDAVVARNGLEKLKTIGDSYMCAGGIPISNDTHAIDACLAGLEFQSFMKQMAEIKASMGLPFWELRIGIHSGPVTAGVIGTNKFAYDVWGDAVNIASRMESSGESGRVNISGITYDLVKDFFECEYRGKVSAKGKGEVDMYFVNSIRSNLSIDAQGKVPNEKFEGLRRSLARDTSYVYIPIDEESRDGILKPESKKAVSTRDGW